MELLKFGNDGRPPNSHPWRLFLPKHEKVVGVASGFQHSALLCESGSVYVFGSRFVRGEGKSKGGSEEEGVRLELAGSDVVGVACGRDNVFLLSDDGGVFACGLNHRGQLGVQSARDEYLPVGVTTLPPVVKIAAGMCHTVALTAEGDIYECGRCLVSKEGSRICHTAFVRVNAGESRFVDIASGAFHYAAIADDGLVFVAGSNSVGELGSGGNANTHNLLSCSPKAAMLPDRAVALACGSYHTVALTADGRLFAWGSNACGQLGVGDTKDRFEPTIVKGLEGEKVAGLSAGGHHTAAILEGGRRAFACGRSVDKELFDRDINLLSMTEILSLTSDLVINTLSFAWSYSFALISAPSLYDHNNNALDTRFISRRRNSRSRLFTALLNNKDSWSRLPHLFVHETQGDQVDTIVTNVVSAHNQLFLLRRVFVSTNHTFLATMHLVGGTRQASRYILELSFLSPSDNRSFVFRCQVSSEAMSVEESFRSTNHSLAFEEERFGEFFAGGMLACRIDVLGSDYVSGLADQLNDLLGHRLTPSL